MQWDLPNPFIYKFTVGKEHLDHYNHVNNADYLRFTEEVSWQHSASLGLTFADYQRLDKALVVTRNEVDYLASAYLNDALELATWITSYDGRFKVSRQFQLINPTTGKTLMRAKTFFACVTLSGGRPCRLPKEFNQIYAPAVVKKPVTARSETTRQSGG